VEILFDKKDSVNAQVRVKIDKSDYQPQIDKSLKEYSKTAAIKGFRPGKVPMPMLQKLFGKDIKVKEINELAKNSLFEYLTANEIQILASPMVSVDTFKGLNWANEDFEFIYDLGLRPEITIDLSAIEVPFYKISVAEAEVNELYERLRLVHSSYTQYEEVAEGHTVFGLLSYGKDTSRFVHIKLDEVTAETKALLLGKKKQEIVEIPTIGSIFSIEEALVKAMRMTAEEVKAIAGEAAKLTIRETFTSVLAEAGQSFYNLVFGEGVVTTDEEFRAKLVGILEKKYDIEARGVAVTYFRNHLLKNVSFGLPDDFLKKWMQSNSEREIANLEEDYLQMREAVSYDLMLSKLSKDHNLPKLNEEALVEKVKETYFLEFFYSRPMFVEGLVDYFAYQFLQTKENQNVIDGLRGAAIAERLLNIMKPSIKANDIALTGIEFEKKELQKTEFLLPE
jgi:trigger factor